MKRILLAVLIAAILFGCQQPAEKPSDTGKVTETPSEKKIEMFAHSSSCFCHDNLRDRSGNDVSILSEWQQSMMAHASKDPYWRAKVSSEIAKFPELEDVIEEKCARCHMPMASFQAKSEGVDVNIQEFLSHKSSFYQLADDGVSCTLCHQILPDNFGQEESFIGNFLIDEKTEKPDRRIFGPFTPVMAQAMRNSAGYTPEEGKHVEKAELCAICHTLYTPYLDDSGNVAGEFPEQTPYLEWLNSRYNPNTPCQKCHMPQSSNVKVSTRPPNLPERSPFFRHVFAGANAQMLELMGAKDGARKAEEMLGSFISIKIVSAEKNGDKLNVDVKVENNAGHKFPTGFPSRRAWIHLKVTDGEGNVVFESGRAENGRIVGEDSPYEPHHDVITKEDDVQIYEAVMVDVNGKVTQTLLRAADYIKDNRIPPKGFDIENAEPDVAVRGKAIADPSFRGGEDVVSYVIDVSGYQGPFRVEAELLYQPVSYPFLKDLEKISTSEIENFLARFAEVKGYTIVSSDTASVS